MFEMIIGTIIDHTEYVPKSSGKPFGPKWDIKGPILG